MKNDHKLIFVSIVLFVIGMLLVPTRLAIAKGTFAKIVVSGGQLKTDIEITDPPLLGYFDLSDFPNARTPEPQITGESYIVTRYEQDNGRFIAWDRLHYYPNSTGSGGYILYDGLINGYSEYDGQWYTASPSGDAALRRMLATHNPNQFTSTQSYLMLVVPGLAMVVATIFIVAVIRKRVTNGARTSQGHHART